MQIVIKKMNPYFMRTPICLTIIVFIFSLLLNASSSYAAFPIPAENTASVSTISLTTSYQPQPITPDKATVKKDRGWMNIVSFVFGVFSIIGLSFASPGIVWAGAISALIGIVLGAMATDEKYSGLGLAGMIVGSIVLLPILIVGIIYYFWDFISLFS